MTAPNIWPPPPKYAMPVSLGRDIIVTFRNTVPDSNPKQYVNYPSGVAVKLVVTSGRGDEKAQAEAVIDGSNALCRIESTVVDTFRNNDLWRCEVTVPDGSLLDDDVPINGYIKRYDGAP